MASLPKPSPSLSVPPPVPAAARAVAPAIPVVPSLPPPVPTEPPPVPRAEGSGPRPRFLDVQTVQEQLADAPQLEQALADDPADLIAAEQLESIYRSEGNHAELAALLLDRAEMAATPADGAALLVEVAELYRDKLDDNGSALAIMHTAFSVDPTSRSVADALDQLAYATGEWDDVIDGYMVAAAKLRTEAPTVASDLWLRIACANILIGDWESVNEALDRVQYVDAAAAGAYLDMVERMTNSPVVLETLGRVCKRINDVDRMGRILSRAVAIEVQPSRKAQLHHALAEHRERLDDTDAAAWHYAEALRLDGNRADSHEALISIYRARDDQRGLARMLEQKRFEASDAATRLALTMEAACLYSDELDEHTHAIDLFASALAVDPEHVDAAVPLAERYWSQQRWHELEPVLDLLTRKAETDATLYGAQLDYRAGHCASQLGNYAKARTHYQAALAFDRDHLEAINECAEACAQLGEHRDSLDYYRRALDTSRRRGASAERLAELTFEVGAATRRCGDTAGALRLFEAAIEAGAGTEAREAAVELYAERGDYNAVVRVRRTQLDDADPAERSRLLAEIGYITGRKLGDPYGAIEIYLRAHDCDPHNRDVLHQLVKLYSAAEMWGDAVGFILRIADLEPDALRRGKFHQAAGTIARHHLDPLEAAEHFDAALECFFVEAEVLPETLRAGCMKAFTDLGRALYDAREWKTLERYYRRMIHRLGQDAPELAELWHGLGQLYRKHLGHEASAIDSFEIASALDSDRFTNHRILIDLYEQAGPDHLAKAIEHRLRLLEDEPFEAEHYRALRHLYAQTEQLDELWCVCRALAMLGKADQQEWEFYQRNRLPEGHLPRAPFSAAIWNRLRHDDENATLSAVIAIVADVCATRFASSPRKLGLGKPCTGDNPLAGLFAQLGQVYGTRPATAYYAESLPADVLVANTSRGHALAPAFVMGRALCEGRTIRATVHSLARNLAYGHPHSYLRRALPAVSELEAVLLAALRVCGAAPGVPARLVEATLCYEKLLRKRLSAPWRARLGEAVSALVRDGRAPNVARWAAGVDQTTRRAALLATGDLEAALADASAGAPITSDDTRERRLADLFVESVSPEHSQMRRALGLAID